MEQMPQWVGPFLTLVTGIASGALSGWIGVKVTVAVLNDRMIRVKEDLQRHERLIGLHDEDLRVLDREMDLSFLKQGLQRVQRQPHRGWDAG